MRPSHYFLIIATIAWLAVAIVWGVDRFVMDLSFAPIELIYVGAFAIAALIGGVVFAQADTLAAQFEFGGFQFPTPKTLMERMRFSARRRRERREETTKRRSSRKQGTNLRLW